MIDYKRDKDSIVSESVVRVIQSYFGSDRTDKFNRCMDLADKAYDLMEADKNLCTHYEERGNHTVLVGDRKALYDALGLDYEKEMDFIRRKQRNSSSVEGLFWDISTYLGPEVLSNSTKKVMPLYSTQELQQNMKDAARMLFEESKGYWANRGFDADSLTVRGTEMVDELSRPYEPYSWAYFNIHARVENGTDLDSEQYKILRNVFDRHGMVITSYTSRNGSWNDPEKDIHIRTLAKNVRECGLRKEMIDALKERVVSPTARTFSDEARQKIREYVDFCGTEGEGWSKYDSIKDAVRNDSEVRCKPEKWFTDAAREFDDIINGRDGEEMKMRIRM